MIARHARQTGPAIRGALSRYLDVAENEHPTKFSIAATAHRRTTNSYEPTRRARIRRRRYCRGEVPNQRLDVRKKLLKSRKPNR
jgi:hypothetical protein